ncbi:MAG: tripartite tricarboxylate transporter TctB family protein [Deltaproteobacteria bacterium]|nr:MAG: tripartite tricarboxylate transporter TctB family protein [Deltaproteobacteria bacterium]
MRAAELVTASVLIFLGGIVLFDAVRIGVGWSPDGPRSGFFPFWLALIMVIVCGVILVQAALDHRGKSFVSREQLNSVLKVLWPATAAVALMHFVGLYVASALYMGFYMRWVGRHSWVAVVAIALGIPIGSFLVFEKWFLVPMPKGPLEQWLGY